MAAPPGNTWAFWGRSFEDNVSMYNLMGSHVEPTRPSQWCLSAPKCAVLRLHAPWWAKIGWPIRCVHWHLGPIPFVIFYMDHPNNDGVPDAISDLPRSAPLKGPTGEDLAVFRPAWVG